jgi:hypothetical protein
MNKIFVLSIFVIIFFSFLRPTQAQASTYYVGCSGGNVVTSTGLSASSLVVGSSFNASAQINSTCSYAVTVNLSTNNNGSGDVGLIGSTILDSGGYTGWYSQGYTAPGTPSNYNVHYTTTVFNSQIFSTGGGQIIYGECYNNPNVYESYFWQDISLLNQWGAPEAAPADITVRVGQIRNGSNEYVVYLIPAGQSYTTWDGYEDCNGNTLRYNSPTSARFGDGTPIAVY